MIKKFSDQDIVDGLNFADLAELGILLQIKLFWMKLNHALTGFRCLVC